MPIWTQWVALVLAVFGAGLSTYNAWYTRRKDSQRFKIVPKLTSEGDNAHLEIRIVNTGTVDLYIDKVFLIRGGIRSIFNRRTHPGAQLGFYEDWKNPILAKPIEPGNDVTFRIAHSTLEVALRERMYVLQATTKIGERVRKPYNILRAVKTLQIPANTPGIAPRIVHFP